MPALRPSLYNQRVRPDGGPFLMVSPSSEVEHGVDVFFADALPETASMTTRVELLMTVTPNNVTIYPLNVRDDSPDYLTPKYGALTEIVVLRRVIEPYPLPSTPDDVIELLEHLPDGFSKDFRFGLGLLWENRSIVETIARLGGVTTLVIAGGNEAELAPPIYHLGELRYHALRRDIARIARRHQQDGLREKLLSTYTTLLHDADPTHFPPRRLRLRKDALSDLTHGGKDSAELSKRDRAAAVQMVKDSVSGLAKEAPSALLALKSDIELLTLQQLIERYKEMLAKDLIEQKWQAFFQSNPFILSLAFAVPTMLIQGNAYVGGTRLNRNGGKYADFLMANAATGNLAIIEIKRPSTELLAKKAYRDNVFGASEKLSGAVTQVLDQRYRIQQEIAQIKENSDRRDIFAYAIRCIVIAGRLPDQGPKQKSLELARNALSGVTVLTFDELLGRLNALHKALSPEEPQPLDVPF